MTRTDETPREITGIVIPVPEAQPFAAHPHVTLLAPFRPRDDLDDPDLRAALKAFFSTVAPFTFALVRVRQFPVGIHYLVPEPADPFRTMTLVLAREFPDTPPYGGQFADVIPHLTIEEGVERQVLPLPIAVRASTAQLVYSYDTVWDVIARFDLGG